jgi:transcriptional regulator with XRE-family HTH domain
MDFEVTAVQNPEDQPLELKSIARRLAAVRVERDLTQTELARRCGLTRQEVNYFETGVRIPRLEHLLRIARALDVPLQRFLSGRNRPGTEVRDLAIELRSLGLVDLWVEAPRVPGAFRRPEEVVALAVSGEEPPARIIEGVPALLAWNRWHGPLLRGFGRATGPRTIYRLAWLAEVALTLERMGGFPGGCPGKPDLEAFVSGTKQPTAARWDSLGKAADEPPALPLWKRWKINYPADLATFRRRAETLASLRETPDGQRPTRDDSEG